MTSREIVLRSTVAALLVSGCSRTIEEDEPIELVEHRILPCTQFCTPLQSDECGANPEDRVDRTAEECVEDCAAEDPGGWGWQWARQEDGTDACAEEWAARAACIDALSCEDQQSYFTRQPAIDTDWPCMPQDKAATTCFYTTPSLERPER
jgi:hypothetical protein